ncbi:MAG: hypothetical protein CM15mP78_05830 [Candidatus Poseidoniales archaeon]|nr:MAG: hypothetical protein CM15mP78_05830 [Candidatus Poseidoniales archaeon]
MSTRSLYLSAPIEDLEVNDTVEYYFSSRDVSTVSSGVNANTSSTFSFERGDPNKVFVVEWHDMSYYTYGQLCTVQALFYDVTNEIEYKYDSNCRTTYNSWSIGYMDQTRQKGASIAHSLRRVSTPTPATCQRRRTSESRPARPPTHGNPSTRVWWKSPTLTRL